MLAREQRQRVVELCIDLSRRGYFSGTGGNLALRLDAEHFAVTPSATDYHSMQAADVCIVRLADLHCTDGARTPSVETGLHARVLRQRPEIHCSIHTHQPVASACALIDARLDLPLDGSSKAVPIVGYMPSGSGLLSRLVGKALRADTNAYLMRNHGVICCGADIDAALASLDALEQLARQHLAGRIAARAGADPSRAAALRRVLAHLNAN